MKNFEALTLEELKIVFEKNQELQNLVLEAAHNDVNYWIGEYMNCFERGAINYNIGYPGNYIQIKNQYEFIQGLKKLQDYFCYLSEEDHKIICYVETLIEKYNNLPYYDNKNANRLDLRIEELTEKVKKHFLKSLSYEYDFYYDTKNLCDYFVEFYSENMNDNYYVDDNYILYQHIEYEKCYK